MLSGHSDFKSLTLPLSSNGSGRASPKQRRKEGIKVESPLLGRRLKITLRLFKEGKKVAHIASELGIGRGSVYRALESAGQAGKSLS
jgi:DNA invertase Pin-like site-specific DNA recombinase